MFRLLGVAVLSLVLPFAAFASAIVTGVSGEVRTGVEKPAMNPVQLNQRIESGSTVSTGPNSSVQLRFDDGQQVLLSQNTEFRIVDFRYTPDPKADRSVFDILRGGARFVTGLIGRRNANAFSLRTPQATIGIRGTDFMVAVVNPLYIQVTQGAIAASNAAGTAAFGAGAVGQVLGSTALATVVPLSQVPAAAAAAFKTMSAVTIAGGTTAGGLAAGAQSGVAAGAATAGGAAIAAPIVVIGVGAAAVGAAVSSGDDTTAPAATTTHHP